MPGLGWAFLFVLFLVHPLPVLAEGSNAVTLWCHNVNCPTGDAREDPLAACKVIASNTAYTIYYDWNSRQCKHSNGYTTLASVHHWANPCDPDYYTYETGACSESPYNPPTCGPGETVETFTIGGVPTYFCELALPGGDDPPETCEETSGYYSGERICAENLAECVNAGGSYGYVNGVPRCVSNITPGAEDPSCGPGQIVIGDAGSWHCETPDDGTPEDVPNVTVIPEYDTDGDGIGDADDPDIDNDGTPNGSDPDCDGDGILNADDLSPCGDGSRGDDGTGGGQGIPDPNNPGQATNSSVSGGGNCSKQPTCYGDAILCSINYQTWATRCADRKLSESGEPGAETFGAGVGATAGTEIDSALGAAGTAILDTTGQEIDTDIGSFESFIVGLFPSHPPCNNVNLNFFGKGTLSISCTKLAEFRDIVGWVIYFGTVLYIFQLAIRPVPGAA